MEHVPPPVPCFRCGTRFDLDSVMYRRIKSNLPVFCPGCVLSHGLVGAGDPTPSRAEVARAVAALRAALQILAGLRNAGSAEAALEALTRARCVIRDDPLLGAARQFVDHDMAALRRGDAQALFFATLLPAVLEARVKELLAVVPSAG